MSPVQSIERSVEIEAYPEDVFPFINNLQAYSQWSPLYAQIADAQIIYGGADEGIGQTMAWQGSESAYPFGSQEIIQSQPGEFVQVKVNLSGREATAHTCDIIANQWRWCHSPHKIRNRTWRLSLFRSRPQQATPRLV